MDLSHLISDISLHTTAEQMKNLLETNFDVGELEVKISRNYPKCYHYRWNVEWLTKAGKQPDFKINASKVTGDDIRVENKVTEGGLFYQKIPAEYLRVITKEPQVKRTGYISSHINSVFILRYPKVG